MFVLSRAEHISDITFAPNTTLQLPTNGGNIPNDRFIYAFRFVFEGRITNLAGPNNPTGRTAGDVYNLIENVSVSGYHRVRGAREEFINLRGAELAQLCRLYSRHDPIKTPAVLDIAASATNDIRFIVDLNFTPLLLPMSQQAQYLLDAPNYESLQLNIRTGDDRSVFSGGSAGAFSAFGSATGNARIRVHGLFAQSGSSRFAGFVPGRVFRTTVERGGADLSTTAQEVRLFNLPRGYTIRSLLVKSGVKASGVTSGNNAFASLSDDILNDIRVYQGLNKPIRRYSDFYSLQEDVGMAWGFRPSSGYALVDFARHGNIQESLKTQGLIAGTTGDTDLYIGSNVVGAAGQAVTFTLEELRYQPANVMRRGRVAA